MADDIRQWLFRRTAETGRVAQPPEIAKALDRPDADIHEALRHLAANKVLILAPNGTAIWAANPFCAVPMGFRVEAAGKTYEAICIWDALGIAAALGGDAVVRASCGDCSEPMTLAIRNAELMDGEGVIHFAVPAHRWWDNIGFT